MGSPWLVSYQDNYAIKEPSDVGNVLNVGRNAPHLHTPPYSCLIWMFVVHGSYAEPIVTLSKAKDDIRVNFVILNAVKNLSV